MTAVYHSQTNGFLFYNPVNPPPDINRSHKLFRPRRIGSGRIHIKAVTEDRESKRLPPVSTDKSRKRKSFKVAVSRDSALRLLRSVKPNQSNPRATEQSNKNRRSWSPVKRTQPGDNSEGGAEDPETNMRTGTRPSISGPIGAHPARPRLLSDTRNHSTASTRSTQSTNGPSPLIQPNGTVCNNIIPQFNLEEERPIASGNGVSVGLHLAEPVLFLQGFETAEHTSPAHTAMLRGSLHIRVQKSAKIKAVTLKFKGKSITKWPEGIPP